MENTIDIGIVDECEPWRLESRFFPSKVGGRPAWLNFQELPLASELECTKCKHQCVFLGQVYAPIETKDECFHRTIFLFLCLNPECCSKNDSAPFLVFRSQLKRRNSFYPFEAPQELETWHPEVKTEKWSELCDVCGCRGSSRCGKCKRVRYCGRSHQIIHWKESHKKNCGKEVHVRENSFSCLLPEFELLIESESDINVSVLKNEGDPDSDSGDDNEERRLREYVELLQDGKTGLLDGVENVDADLLQMAACEDDRAFTIFKTRISHKPTQVLRYDRGGTPLWISDQNLPSEEDILCCPYCGSRRIFEFQILPQLLNHLGLDRVDRCIDWGVLAVFTCENSCDEGPAYKREILWKQDINS